MVRVFCSVGSIDNPIPIFFCLGLNAPDNTSKVYRIKHLNISWTIQKCD